MSNTLPKPLPNGLQATTLALLAALGPLASAETPSVPYPDGYRSWGHVKSAILEPGHPLYDSFGGLHHIYANDTALAGYRSGNFADGSVIVFDLLEVVEADHAIAEGSRKVLGVMQRDGTAYADTGGWGFEGFAGGDPGRPVVGDQARTLCFGCHQEQASDTGMVFSTWRD